MNTPYRYDPMALFEQSLPTEPSPVFGFAADGFPIFGSYIADNGVIRAATSSYLLKPGMRPADVGGIYDGTFIDDWVYVEGLGDLDACNGMEQEGVYGYVATATYPHVLGCFVGTPDPSFQKRRNWQGRKGTLDDTATSPLRPRRELPSTSEVMSSSPAMCRRDAGLRTRSSEAVLEFAAFKLRGIRSVGFAQYAV